MVRRRKGTLLPLEVGILSVSLQAGEGGTHGFALAKVLADRGETRNLTASGTLYRTLGRLESAGLLESWWEDPDEAVEQGRPRRRLYRITGEGRAILAAQVVDADDPRRAVQLRPGLSM